ncbi:hypothetical protein TB2_037089 [Malus domestica]
MRMQSWSDLPPELLSMIADRLGECTSSWSHNKWVQVNIRSTRAMISTIECNAYRTRKLGFYFLDGKDGLLVVPISKSTVSPEVSSVTNATHTTSKAEIFSTYKKYFKSTNMKEKLGIAVDEDVSISTCGTVDPRNYKAYVARKSSN